MPKSTASTLTGTVSDVSVSSAAKLVGITRWSTHAEIESTNGMIQNKPGPRKPTYLPSRRTTARSHCRATFGACESSSPRINPTITPMGLNVNQVASAPIKSGVSKTTADTTFTRGISVAGTLLLGWVKLVDVYILVRLLLAPALKSIQQVVDGEPHRIRFFQKAIDELCQVLLVFFVMIAVEMAGADKRSHASSCFGGSRAFQLGINFCHRIGIDAQLDC